MRYFPGSRATLVCQRSCTTLLKNVDLVFVHLRPSQKVASFLFRKVNSMPRIFWLSLHVPKNITGDWMVEFGSGKRSSVTGSIASTRHSNFACSDTFSWSSNAVATISNRPSFSKSARSGLAFHVVINPPGAASFATTDACSVCHLLPFQYTFFLGL